MGKNNKSNLSIAIIGLIVFVGLALSGCGTNSVVENKNAAPTKNWNEIFAKAPPGASPAWSKGSPTAVVTIEEFADFECPTCAQMNPKVNEIRSAFGDKVRIVFRQFPLTGRRWSYDAACATEAAGMQGKFWEMQNLLFTNQQNWSSSADARALFMEYAKTIGLNVEQFSNDMIGLPAKNRVDSDLQRGRAIGVGSTPSFYINNKPLGSNLEGLRAMVEKALQEAEGAKTAMPETNSNSTNK